MFRSLFTSNANARIQAEAALRDPELQHRGYNPMLGIGDGKEDFGLSRMKAPDNSKVAEEMIALLAQYVPKSSKEKARLEGGHIVAPTAAFHGVKKALSDRGREGRVS